MAQHHDDLATEATSFRETAERQFVEIALAGKYEFDGPEMAEARKLIIAIRAFEADAKRLAASRAKNPFANPWA